MICTKNDSFNLSILLVTYNHKHYIRQALDSLFGQIIDGPIQIVVADDASTDSTLSIIREYEDKDPRFHFKYLDSGSNIGITKNYQRGFAACNAEYIAVLEGDDYWINPRKLQHQRDFLGTHWECDLCSVNYLIYDEEKHQFTKRTKIGHGHRFLSARDLIANNLVGNFSTCMYRKKSLDSLPSDLFEIKSYDWIVNICVARKSLIGFLNEPMSVYRLHSQGAWSNTSHINKLKTQLELLPAYDALTNHVFRPDFDRLAHRLREVIAPSLRDHIVKAIAYTMIRTNHGILNYMPPLGTKILRALVPPAIKRFWVAVITRNAV